jgi:hypothetical protein
MIVINTHELARVRRKLDKVKGGANKALARAMNRTVRAGRTELSRGVRAVYLIKQKDLYSTLKIRNASPGNLSAEIRSSYTGMLKLFDFKVSPRNPSRKATVHAQVRVDGGGSISSGFIGQMASGHIGVFMRRGSNRLPIRELRTISAPIMISQADVSEPVGRKMDETFKKRIDHEVSRLLQEAK